MFSRVGACIGAPPHANALEQFDICIHAQANRKGPFALFLNDRANPI